MTSNPLQRRSHRLAWVTLWTNIAVILWGAFVRSTGSGAGCGEHWPECNGEVVPRPESVETWIELIHRATSGIALLLTLALLITTFRAWPTKSPARRGARDQEAPGHLEPMRDRTHVV